MERSMKTVLSLFLASIMLVSCTPPPPDVAEVRKTLEAMSEKSEKDMMAGIMDTTMANYTDDAVSMPNNGPMLKGKQALKQYYVQMMGMGMKFPKVDFVTADVMVGGMYAYEVGTYTMTMEMVGMPQMTDEGKYLTVYERGADGKWRIKVETWNTNMPMAMPEPPKMPEAGKKKM
jgi:ketosteroid isomerase-like protein